jgi:hypothetical protein
MQARIAAGEKVIMVDEEDFDPFPDEVHDDMSTVKWKDPWGLVGKLLKPVDEVMDERRPAPDESTYWLSIPQLLANFKFDPNTQEATEGMTSLTALMDKTFDLD